jgi:hypothetical protein
MVKAQRLQHITPTRPARTPACSRTDPPDEGVQPQRARATGGCSDQGRLDLFWFKILPAFLNDDPDALPRNAE